MSGRRCCPRLPVFRWGARQVNTASSLSQQPRPETRSLSGASEGLAAAAAAAAALRPASEHHQPHHRRRLTRLYSQNGGYHLRILDDGAVSGGRQDDDPYELLRLKAVSAGVVVIVGEATGRYLAMNKKGRLYGAQALNDECYFQEKYEENHYNTYRSQKYGWYVGLKRNGQPKAGPNTHLGQKAVYFLPRSADSA